MAKTYNKATIAAAPSAASVSSKQAPSSESSKKEGLGKTTAELAYERWQSRGCPHGDDWSDWLAAEKR